MFGYPDETLFRVFDILLLDDILNLKLRVGLTVERDAVNNRGNRIKVAEHICSLL